MTPLDKQYAYPIWLLLALYTAIGRGVQYVFTALMIMFGFIVILLRLERVLHWGIVFWARMLFLILGKRVWIKGQEHIQPNHKYILVTNHASLYDIPAIMACYPRVAWLGRSYLTRIPAFGFFLKQIDYIPIDPGNREKPRLSLRQAIQKANSLTVALFPEGTRTLTGQIGPFKRGFVHLLRETGLDLLPVTMNGLFAFKPKHRFVIDPRPRLEVIIHPPISNAELVSLTDEEIVAKVREIVLSSYGQANFYPTTSNATS